LKNRELSKFESPSAGCGVSEQKKDFLLGIEDSSWFATRNFNEWKHGSMVVRRMPEKIN